MIWRRTTEQPKPWVREREKHRRSNPNDQAALLRVACPPTNMWPPRAPATGPGGGGPVGWDVKRSTTSKALAACHGLVPAQPSSWKRMAP